MTTQISTNLQQVFENHPSLQFCKSKNLKASQLKVGVIQAPDNPNCLKDVYVKVSEGSADSFPWHMLFIRIFSLQLQAIPPQYFEKFILYLSNSKKIQLEKQDVDLLAKWCKRSDLNNLSNSAIYWLMELFERAGDESIPHLESILTKEKLEAIVQQGKSSIEQYVKKKIRALETRNLDKLADLHSKYKLESGGETQDLIQALTNQKFRISLYSLINQVGKFLNSQKRDSLLEYLFSIFKEEEDCFYFFSDAMKNKPLQFFENFIKNLFYNRKVILENEDVVFIAEYCKTLNLAALSNSTLYYLIQLFEMDGEEVIPNLESILTEEKLKAIVLEGQAILSQKLPKDIADHQFRIHYYSIINHIGKFSDLHKRDRYLECLFSIFIEEDIIDYLLASEEEGSNSIDRDDSYNSRASSYCYEDMGEDFSQENGESNEVSSYGSRGVNSYEDMEQGSLEESDESFSFGSQGVIEEIPYDPYKEDPFIETALVNVIRASQNPKNPLFSRALNAIVETINCLSKERADTLKLILIHSITDEQRKYLIEKHGDVFFNF